MQDSKPRILVVDDEAFNIEIIQGYLEDEDYLLDTAQDGVEAWEKLEREPESYDAVLLDRMMPRMNGMEVLARIKEHPLLRQTPVILQTARAAKADVVEGIRAGAYYYLAKPFDEAMLISVVRTAVRDSRQYRRVRDELKETTRTLGLMREARFRYRTLTEARGLAALLANACPHAEAVVMGLAELMINAVEHGNLGISYAEKSALNETGGWEAEVERRLARADQAERFVEVEMIRDDQEIRVVITDQGAGFDWSDFLSLSPERAMDNHGRGIAMAGLLSFSRIEYRGRGNEVVAAIAL